MGWRIFDVVLGLGGSWLMASWVIGRDDGLLPLRYY